ncbi:MAG: phosphoesterase [Acidobacteria bacterium]|nr:phosphoesterase [Acidobacteriota bacterium]
MQIRVFYHDHCFDGAASAAYFSRFIEARFHPGAEFTFTGLAHGPSQYFDDSLFDGEENAIVDFKYSPHPRITWWFDHHQSAFLTPEDAEHFQRNRSGNKFYDPTYKSCTLFISTVARERFGYQAPDLAQLVHWANIIDGALYSDARTAVELGAPAMPLTLVIEGAKGPGAVQRIIGWMRHRTLEEIMAEPEIQEIYKPLYESHLASVEVIRHRAVQDNGVLFFDLTGYEIEGYNKFIPYYLFPECTYTVSISPSSFRTKISVGSNPWAPHEPRHNLATICERYGGGGHPRVGAISLPPGELERARRTASEIVEELKR